MPNKKSRWPSLLVAAITLALVAAACGSTASPTPAVASAAPPASAAPAASVPAASMSASPSPAASAAPAASVATVPATVLKVALVAPSTQNDLSWTQAMVDALQRLQQSQNLQISISDNQYVVATSANVIQKYASQGYNLIIAHGSQYGSIVQQLAPQYPNVSFAWGTAGSTFNLPNVFAYSAAANQGGYVAGAMAAMLSKKHVLGAIGPFAVGDDKLFIDGFVAGAKSIDKSVTINPVYTGSYSDVSLYAATAKTFVAGGADVLAGTTQASAGAIGVANSNNIPWFGNQWSMASLAPKVVVATEVYDWASALTSMFTEIRAGTLGGASFTINFGNGGEVMQFNPGYALPANVKAKADELIKGITDETISIP
jgi:basic membrane lipoprotein Med (substrate-binding protein (PBP1-ABC) superfamily)